MCFLLFERVERVTIGERLVSLLEAHIGLGDTIPDVYIGHWLRHRQI